MCCFSPPKDSANHKLAQQEGTCEDNEGIGFFHLLLQSPDLLHPTSSSSFSSIHISLYNHWRMALDLEGQGEDGRKLITWDAV